MLAVVERSAPARKSKPPELVRGEASRLPWAWNGLVFAVPFHESSRDGARDAVTQKQPSGFVNDQWIQDFDGNPALNLSNTAYIKWAANPVHDQPSSELTVHVRFWQDATPDAVAGMLTHTRVGPPSFTWSLFYDTTDGTSGGITVGGVTTSLSVIHALASNQHLNYFLRWRSGSAVQLDVLNDRGRNIGSGSSAAVTGTLDYTSLEQIRVNAHSTPDENSAGWYSQAMVWARKLTDTEMAALAADPFGWYSPRRETVGVASPFPILLGSAWRVFGYAMFPTTGERDAMQAKVQEWVAAHTADQVWASGHTIHIDDVSTPYALTAGQATPSLNDSDGGGPWPGFTWSYQVASQGLRDDFGAVTSASEAGPALDGSQWGEATT